VEINKIGDMAKAKSVDEVAYIATEKKPQRYSNQISIEKRVSMRQEENHSYHQERQDYGHCLVDRKAKDDAFIVYMGQPQESFLGP